MAPRSPRDWLEQEEPILRGAVAELQRIVRRARARWPRVVALALLLTAAFAWRLAKKPAQNEASITLAITEGKLARRDSFLPVADLRNYVVTVLMPTAQLAKLCDDLNLFPLRKKFGPQFAAAELLDTVEVDVLRNYFLYEDDTDAPRSARIDITAIHANADIAYALVNGVADIIAESTRMQRDRAAAEVMHGVERISNKLASRTLALAQRIALTDQQLERARQRGDMRTAAQMLVDKQRLSRERTNLERDRAQLSSSVSIARLSASVAAAGQDIQVQRVAETRPTGQGQRLIVVAFISSIVLFFMLVVATIVFGAFDTRIHDTDDLRRLGVPILGQLPTFAGQHLGSMKSRMHQAKVRY